jgi:hypothetical protein
MNKEKSEWGKSPKGRPAVLKFKQGNIKGQALKWWYRGEHCNFNPYRKNIDEEDAIEKYVLQGWLPDQPLINKKTNIVAFGSCFAANILRYLKEVGYNINSKNALDFQGCLGAGVNTTFAIKDSLEWIYENKQFNEETWHDENKKPIKREQETRKRLLKTLRSADFFIITLGLSEVWSNKKTKEVFWRAIPGDLFNKDLHEFRVSTVQENKENIKYIYDIINKYSPKSTVLFTLSPISLAATFRPISCITANNVSKSILRAALDEFCREQDIPNNDRLYYWPSYEIVEKVLPLTITGGPYIEDNRRIKKECLDKIMKLFEKYYLIKG